MEWAAPEASELSRLFADHQARNLAQTGPSPREQRLGRAAEALAETTAQPGPDEAS